MLSQFTVKNYKSIREEITLDMQAASISEHEDRIIKDADGEKYLPVASVYGPNGGGKSNVLEAINVLILKLLRPLAATEDVNSFSSFSKNQIIEPFAFSEDRNKPTEFELFFRTNIAEYRYILHVKQEEVIYESLDRIKFDTRRMSGLFVRSEDGIELKGDISKLKVSADLSKTLPVLSYLGIAYKENEVVNDVFKWFSSGIISLNYGNPIQEMQVSISKSEKVKDLVLQMITEMDLDISDYRIVENENGYKSVYTKHIVDNEEAEISLANESSGTQKIFGLLPFIIQSLLKGATLIVDELDAKLHPMLLKHIIMMFNNLEINTKKAQLIFTSHDLSTMNSEIFRRDEIWFVAKGKAQNSQLYSLVEFKNEKGVSVRKDAKFDKQYLEGKYGADPYLRRIIDWGELNA